MVIQQQLSVITESTTQSLPETTAQNQHHTNIDYDIELTDDGNTPSASAGKLTNALPPRLLQNFKKTYFNNPLLCIELVFSINR